MADTLLDVAMEALAHATAERARAQAELTAAEQALATAEHDLASATVELTTRQDEVTAIQREIAETKNAAAGGALYARLEATTILARASQAKIADAGERVAEATTRIGAAQDELDHSGAAQAAARLDVDAADAKTEALQAWRTAATTTPLSGLPNKADVTTGGGAKPAFDSATNKLKNALGSDLFDRAHDRRVKRDQRLDDLVTAAKDADDKLAAEAAKVSLAGKRAQAALAFERADEALRDFALTAQERYDRAIALLAAAGGAPAPSAAQAARITALSTDAKSANAFDLEKKRDDARRTLQAAEGAVDTARLAALAADPSADPEDDATVKSKLLDVGTAKTALETAEVALEATVRNKLDTLEAAVPDEVWERFDAYEEARELLARLAAVNPATLAGTAAEAAYAVALRNERAAAAAVVVLGEFVGVLDRRAETAAETRPARLFEALRGDA
jgi:hypothetical protein